MCASEIQEVLTANQYVPDLNLPPNDVANIDQGSAVGITHHQNAGQIFDEAVPYFSEQIFDKDHSDFVLDAIDRFLPEDLNEFFPNANLIDTDNVAVNEFMLVDSIKSVAHTNLDIQSAPNENLCHEASNEVAEKIHPNGLLAKFGLPCQNDPNYDYNQCYSFYVNGCYNTCQFVESCDIEDFMNNEKRKEKSRDAARCRRSKETEIFNDLGSALPLSSEQISQLDKASVMRLAISYLKVRDMISLVPTQSLKGNKPKDMPNLKDESVFSKSLEGFVLVLSTEGDFIYLSENVSDYLGISQIDLMGQNVFEYSHPCDHEEIREMLSSKKEDDVEAPKSTFIRLKCTLTSKGRSVNLKSATYKVIHCTGHMIQDPLKHEEPNANKIQNCLVAVGQPIPHPSNIDTPLPTQTFLTKHNLDMKFTHADDKFMMDILGYTSEDLLNKSVYEYHHALDSESVGPAYKCLFSKGQCETSRYRFLAKTGGYCWVVTQATLIYDKMQKPQSVVCVNHVISGVENQDEIYALHQLTAAKEKVVPSAKVVPDIRVELVKEEQPQKVLVEDNKIKVVTKRSVPVSITNKLFSFCYPPKSVPISATEELFAPLKASQDTREPLKDVLNGAKPPEVETRPRTSTKSIFAPRTDDMNKGFLTYSDKEPGLTIMKEDPDDLTHLAPDAGEAMIRLGNPFLNEDFDNIDWVHQFEDTNFVPLPLLSDEPSDPIFNYRDYRDGSPQLLSPNMSKSPDYSLPSLSAGSPNGSLSDEDQMSTFINLQMDDDCENLSKISSEDLPLFLSSSDLLWSNNEKNKEQIPENNSSLAELLSASVNKHSIKQQSDHGGGTLEREFLEVPSNNSVNRPWCTKSPPIKMEIDSTRQTPNLERTTQSIKRHNSSNCYDHQQSKRSRQEPKSTELLQQLMSNNTHHNRGRPKGKSMCISQPSDSVLMNLLDNSNQSSRTSSPCVSMSSRTCSPCLSVDTSPIVVESMESSPVVSPNSVSKAQIKQNLPLVIKSRLYNDKNMADLPRQFFEQQQKMQEERQKLLRKTSLTLLLPDSSNLPDGQVPLPFLTQQDCEVNAPVNNLLLHGDELFWALDTTSKIIKL